MANKDDKFWMSIIQKYENRQNELKEQHCNLEQRLLSLKRRISSSQNDICSCCSQSFESSPEPSRISSVNFASAPTKMNDVEDLGNVSLNSMDMQYISTLNEIINRERQLKQQVREMEQREQVLLSSLKQIERHSSKNFTPPSEEKCQIMCENNNRKLLEENARLGAALEDAKLELKHCMEQLHGPMARSLEQERRKSRQLEDDLNATNEEMAAKDCCYREDMCCLKNRLEVMTKTLSDTTQQNENLQRQLCSLTRKYKDLQRDLISQKLNEARTLERLNELLSEKERTAVRDRQPVTSRETQKELDLQTVPEKEEKETSCRKI